MKLVVISSAPFIYKQNCVFGYSPYIDELIIWEKHVDQIMFCCPTWSDDRGLLVTAIPFLIEKHYHLSDFNLNTFFNGLKAFFYSMSNLFVLYQALQKADHIHLRCPGNIGLLACIVQILFPKTPKSTKYAGNWDPKAKQPWTYRLQKWIVSNSFLTRNMQVLVYGEWAGSNKNIKPFFTATYREAEIVPVLSRSWNNTINFVFVGTLVAGKNPLYAIQLVEQFYKKGYDVQLTLYGEGVLRPSLEHYIIQHNLENVVELKGNQSKETVKNKYQDCHFIVLPSTSEGWPKVVAEAMFWGCIPLSTSVSCVPFMLDYGNRGVLLVMDLEKDCCEIEKLLSSPSQLATMGDNGMVWSRKYTVEVFEHEIKKILDR